jgi:hypothetical protein
MALNYGGYDGSNVWVSVDNTNKGTQGLTGNLNYNSDTAVYFGDRQWGGQAEEFHGAIDNIMIWNRALTTAEQTTVYNGGSGHIIT